MFYRLDNVLLGEPDPDDDRRQGEAGCLWVAAFAACSVFWRVFYG